MQKQALVCVCLWVVAGAMAGCSNDDAGSPPSEKARSDLAAPKGDAPKGDAPKGDAPKDAPVVVEKTIEGVGYRLEVSPKETELDWVIEATLTLTAPADGEPMAVVVHDKYPFEDRINRLDTATGKSLSMVSGSGGGDPGDTISPGKSEQFKVLMPDPTPDVFDNVKRGVARGQTLVADFCVWTERPVPGYRTRVCLGEASMRVPAQGTPTITFADSKEPIRLPERSFTETIGGYKIEVADWNRAYDFGLPWRGPPEGQEGGLVITVPARKWRKGRKVLLWKHRLVVDRMDYGEVPEGATILLDAQGVKINGEAREALGTLTEEDLCDFYPPVKPLEFVGERTVEFRSSESMGTSLSENMHVFEGGPPGTKLCSGRSYCVVVDARQTLYYRHPGQGYSSFGKVKKGAKIVTSVHKLWIDGKLRKGKPLK